MNKSIRYLLFSCLLIVVFLFGGLSGVGVEHAAIAAVGLLNSATPTAVPPTSIPNTAVPPTPLPSSTFPFTYTPTEPLPTATPIPIPPLSSGVDLNLINQAWKDIQNNYVDQSAVVPQDLTYAAISAMVNALGDTGHSRFLSPAMVSEENRQLQGQFDGVGIEVQLINNQIVIVAPIDNSPAQKAGLKPGDIIQKVDGVDVTGWTIDELVSHVLGPAGTQVTLTILDPTTKKTTDYTLTRAHIVITNVTWTMVPGTNLAYIYIAQFATGVDKDLANALQAAIQQNATGVILDLRNDPGGYVDQAIAVASQFKATGLVFEDKDAKGNITKVPVNPGGIATKLPLVVLVNQGSASASEIVTAALQDGHRATVVGDTTVGTGTVLNVFKLSDGSELLLATSEWLTPAGESFWHKGLTPDVPLPLADGVYPLTPARVKAMTADQLKASQDVQLLKAIDLLTGAAH